MKSSRNKTIDTPFEEGIEYFEKCLQPEQKLSVDEALNQVLYGDNLEICKLLPEKSIDLIVTDPPYNLTKNYGGTVFSKKKDSEYYNYTYQWLSAIKPLLKPNGSIYVCCDWTSSLTIGDVMNDMFNIRNRITWQREKRRGAASNWKNGMEDIWYATNGSSYTFNLDAVKQRRRVNAPYKEDGSQKDWTETKDGNFRDTCPSNFWDDITIPFWSMAENTAHPTQKPEKLIAKIILASSNEGDIIFDPFLGSGTTAVTAKKLNRNFIGIEREKQYCVWAQQRLEMADTDKNIQGYVDGVFWERNSAPKRKK